MLNSQRIQLRISEIRSKLNEVAAGDGAMSPEQETEAEALRNEYRSAETRLQAAIIAEAEQADQADQAAAEGEPATSEQRELRDLQGAARAETPVLSVVDGNAPTGATKELQELRGLAANILPFDLFLEDDSEQRAATLPTGSALPSMQRPTRPMIFPTPVTRGLVRQSRVGAGTQSYPIVTAPTDSPQSVAVTDTVGDSDTTIGAETASAVRVQRSFSWEREEAAQFANLESDLRRLLNDNMSAALERQALLQGDRGIFQHGTDPTAGATEADSFNEVSNLLFAQLDGRLCDSLSQVQFIIGSATLAKWAALWRGNNAAMNAPRWIEDNGAMYRVTAHAPVTTNSGNEQECVIVLGKAGPHVEQALWSGVELIRDIYTGSATGLIRLTAVVMSNVTVARPAHIKRTGLKIGT